MTIKTMPVFYFVNPIGINNNKIDFVEPNVSVDELTGTIRPGSWTMTEIVDEIKLALDTAGANEYTVSFDRDTRIVTISADDDFDLLVSTGTNAGNSIYSDIGFTGADQTGADTYDSDSAMGSQYIPQFLPQSFSSFDNNEVGFTPSENEAPSGVTEVVAFGFRQFMRMNLKYITDVYRVKGAPVRNNPTGVQDARDFLSFCIRKSYLEYMPDKDTRAEFDKIILESTAIDRKGTAYRLNELIGEGMNDYFQTGTLTFRRI